MPGHNRSLTLLPRGLGKTRGGPGTFARNLTQGLSAVGINVTDGERGGARRPILVVNGTRDLRYLLAAKWRGARIVQRLGLPTIGYQRSRVSVAAIETALRNQLVNLIRQRIASHVVYQSQFARSTWEENFGPTDAPTSVIYNGVDTQRFSPGAPQRRANGCPSVLSLEGTQGIDPYETATRTVAELRSKGIEASLTMVGQVIGGKVRPAAASNWLTVTGAVPHEATMDYYRTADVYLFTDYLTGACPNSVLEAMACGLPVVGYDHGPLRELVSPGTGRLVPPLGNPVQGHDPDRIRELATAIADIANNKETYGREARTRAVADFSLSRMCEQYVSVLFQP